MRRWAALVGCIAAVGCATVKDGDMQKRVGIIAHRGASAYAPENTLAAFLMAREMGADWFELDCTLSKDGEVIVIHDNTVDRTTNGKGAVGELTLDELKRLDAGSWKDPRFAGEKLPTLGEALDVAGGGTGVYIEIKDSDDDKALMGQVLALAEGHTTLTPELRGQVEALIGASGSRNVELTRKVVALVREKRLRKQVVVQSFSPIVCAVAMAEDPGLRVELLGYDDEKKADAWEGFLRWGYLLDVAGFNPSYGSLTAGRLAAFHAAGKSVSVWTVDKEEDWRRFAGWGIDNLITNRPDECRKVVGR